MGSITKYKCNFCQYQYVLQSGGVKDGVLTPYFCFTCLTLTSFMSYREDYLMRNQRNPGIEPRYKSYLLKRIAELETQGYVAELLYQDVMPSVIAQSEYQGRYLDLFKDTVEKFKQDHTDWKKRTDQEEIRIKEFKNQKPYCKNCQESEVFEIYKEDQCPICAHKMTKIGRPSLID